MTAAVVLPLLINTIYSGVSLRHLIDSRVTQKELPASLREIRNSVELEIQKPLIISQSIAQNQFVIDWLKDGEDAAQLEGNRKYLEAIGAKNDAVTSFVVSGLTGKYYTNSGLLKTLSPDSARDQWFYTFLNSGQRYEVSIDIDEDSGKPTAFINYGIEVDGRIRAVGGIGKSLSDMESIIRGYRLGESGQVYLVDKQGDIQLHRDKSNNNKTLNDLLKAASVSEQLLNGDSLEIVEFGREGEQYFAASIPLLSLDWYLVAEIPKHELYSDLSAAMYKTLLVSLVVAVAFLLLMGTLATRLSNPIKKITDQLVELSQRDGDLTVRLPENRTDELGQLAVGLNGFLEQLHSMCLNILQTTESLRGSGNQVKVFMDKTDERTDQQQRNTIMVATAVNEMGSTVVEVARNASQAACLSQDVRSSADQGSRTLDGTIKDMQELSGAIGNAVNSVESLALDIQSITSVLDVIKGISEQTNLLALNAAIEAARAGEQGRGFAVVADEVRTLAQRTAQSTEEINEMIQRLTKSAEDAVETIQSGQQLTSRCVGQVDNTGTALNAITENIEQMTDMNNLIASATEEQSIVTEEINTNVTQIAEYSRMTAEDVAQCSDLCRQLNQQTSDLSELVGKFKL